MQQTTFYTKHKARATVILRGQPLGDSWTIAGMSGSETANTGPTPWFFYLDALTGTSRHF
ncbi:hypothetical protein CP966_20225 [Streptomyces galilaeus]|nr:hypothetical protein CP966_20225 [Streptomyces galilaeus]GGW45053.1 hypothetical protein GCM10010350_31200 [Streptomyces galilaeus]